MRKVMQEKMRYKNKDDTGTKFLFSVVFQNEAEK